MNEPLDSRQLRAFVTLANVGSFTQAAAELFLSQSAISHSIRSLEESLHCRLLDRVGKKVILTFQGEQFLVHAERILREMTTARQAIQQLNQWGTSRMRLGASATACQYILPPVITEFRKCYPHCSITIEPGDSPKILRLLQDRKIDLGITLELTNEDQQTDFLPLFEDDLKFIISPEHPWARQDRVAQSEIPSQNYINYDSSTLTFRLIEAYFKAENLTLNAQIQLGNIEAIKELVKLGLGISILAPWVARKEIQNGELCALSLGRRKLKRQWGILSNKSTRLGLPAETFVKLCQRVTAGWCN